MADIIYGYEPAHPGEVIKDEVKRQLIFRQTRSCGCK